jgi:hypothetical protein
MVHVQRSYGVLRKETVKRDHERCVVYSLAFRLNENSGHPQIEFQHYSAHMIFFGSIKTDLVLRQTTTHRHGCNTSRSRRAPVEQ